MTKREREIEHLLTARGLELFILSVTEKLESIQKSVFVEAPQAPRNTENTNIGVKPQPPQTMSGKSAFSLKAFFEDITCDTILGIFLLLALTALWIKTIHSPILFDWRNIILLMLAAIAVCLWGLAGVRAGGDFSIVQGIRVFIVGTSGVIALFGSVWLFLLALPLHYMVSIIKGISEAKNENARIQNEYSKANSDYQKRLFQWQNETKRVAEAKTEYQQKSAQYEKDFNQWADERNSWNAENQRNIHEYQRVIAEAVNKRDSLYDSERIIPLPYRYAEAVCYLYDFLSTSPDEFDMKFALERQDHAQIRQMMGAIISNQSRQLALATIQIIETRQLHNDNIKLRSTIQDTGAGINETVRGMSRRLSSDIANAEHSISSGIRAANNSIQSGNRQTARLMSDIAGHTLATAEATGYLAAINNEGVLPAQWAAQEFLIHNRRYL